MLIRYTASTAGRAGRSAIAPANMNALSIRQPYAEEILRGIKKIEYRNRPTKVIGVTFYIYAAMKVPTHAGIPERFRKLGSAVGGLPTGVLVGTAKISKCTPWSSGGF